MKKVPTFSLFNFQINAVKRILQFVLFIIPLFYFAISIDPILPQHTNDTVIYVSFGSIIVDESHIFNAKIVEVRTPIEKIITKKLVVLSDNNDLK